MEEEASSKSIEDTLPRNGKGLREIRSETLTAAENVCCQYDSFSATDSVIDRWREQCVWATERADNDSLLSKQLRDKMEMLLCTVTSDKVNQLRHALMGVEQSIHANVQRTDSAIQYVRLSGESGARLACCLMMAWLAGA